MTSLKTKFEIGDRVRIAKTSMFYGKDPLHNPKDVVGTVTRYNDGLGNVVSWDNGGENDYGPEDLELVVPPTEGVKYDSGKPDLSLCPKVALEEMAKAFMIGEKKYGRYNYLKGFDVHRLVAAAMRHLSAFNEGEDYDPEYGYTKHLGHALASIAMILDMEANGTLKETRYVRGQGLKADLPKAD